jgi:hypothetical protein
MSIRLPCQFESAFSLMQILMMLDFSNGIWSKLELNIEELDLYKLTNQVIDLFILNWWQI